MLGPRAGIALQSDVEARSDVLVYSTEPLERAVEVTGPVKAALSVSTAALSTDFTVKLVDVYPDGRAYNVTDGILRRTYSAATPTHAPTDIAVDLWPTSMLSNPSIGFASTSAAVTSRATIEIQIPADPSPPKYDRLRRDKSFTTAHSRRRGSFYP